MSKLNDILKELHSEAGADVIQMTVCGPDGFGIASESTIPDKEMAEMMTGRVAMAQGAGKKVVEKLKLGDFQEMIGTTEKAYIITKVIGDGSYFIAMSATRKATLGTIRMLIEEYSPRIWDAIPR